MNRWYAAPVLGLLGLVGYGVYDTVSHRYGQSPLDLPLLLTANIDEDNESPPDNKVKKPLPEPQPNAMPEKVPDPQPEPTEAKVIPVPQPTPAAEPPKQPVPEPSPVPVVVPTPKPKPAATPPMESKDKETKSPTVAEEKKVASSGGPPSPVPLNKADEPTPAAPEAKQKTDDAEDDESYIKGLSGRSLAKLFRPHLLLAKKSSKAWARRAEELAEFYKGNEHYIELGEQQWVLKEEMNAELVHEWCSYRLSGGTMWNYLKLGQPKIWYPRIWKWCAKDPNKTPPLGWWSANYPPKP